MTGTENEGTQTGIPVTEDVSTPAVHTEGEVSTPAVHTEPDVSTPDVHTDGDGKKPRGSIRPPADLYEEFLALKRDDESVNDLLKRLVDVVPTLTGQVNDLTSENEHLQNVNDTIREDLRIELARQQERYDQQVHEIGGLRAQIATLVNQVETGVVPVTEFGSLGMKDIADEINDGCKGDETCIDTVVKLQQTRIVAMSKHLDRDHDATQKQLAREHDATQRQIELDAKKEAQEKDRALKESLAEKEQTNKIELQLAKKGGFKNKFLEDITFLGGGTSKRPKRDLAEAEKRAHQKASGDDQWLGTDADDEEELQMHPEFDETEI